MVYVYKKKPFRGGRGGIAILSYLLEVAIDECEI